MTISKVKELKRVHTNCRCTRGTNFFVVVGFFGLFGHFVGTKKPTVLLCYSNCAIFKILVRCFFKSKRVTILRHVVISGISAL